MSPEDRQRIAEEETIRMRARRNARTRFGGFGCLLVTLLAVGLVSLVVLPPLGILLLLVTVGLAVWDWRRKR